MELVKKYAPELEDEYVKMIEFREMKKKMDENRKKNSNDLHVQLKQAAEENNSEKIIELLNQLLTQMQERVK